MCSSVSTTILGLNYHIFPHQYFVVLHPFNNKIKTALSATSVYHSKQHFDKAFTFLGQEHAVSLETTLTLKDEELGFSIRLDFRSHIHRPTYSCASIILEDSTVRDSDLIETYLNLLPNNNPSSYINFNLILLSSQLKPKIQLLLTERVSRFWIPCKTAVDYISFRHFAIVFISGVANKLVTFKQQSSLV